MSRYQDNLCHLRYKISGINDWNGLTDFIYSYKQQITIYLQKAWFAVLEDDVDDVLHNQIFWHLVLTERRVPHV